MLPVLLSVCCCTCVVSVCCCTCVECSELLWTLNDAELHTLETALCTTVDESEQSSSLLANLSTSAFDHRTSSGRDEEPYYDDSSDTEPSTSMVHSDSTMTVVAARNDDSDDNDGATNGQAATASSSFVEPRQPLPDVEARHLQHSLSWPQSTDSQRAVSSADGDSPASSSSAIALCGAREFVLNLPCNTSLERLSAGSSDTNLSAMKAANDGGIIYLSNGGGVPSNDESRQQITFITDEFCRLFGANISDESDLMIPDGDDSTERLLPAVMYNSVDVIACQCDGDGAKATPACSAVNSRTENADSVLPPPALANGCASVPVGHASDNVSKDASGPCRLPSTSGSVKSGVGSSLHRRTMNNATETVKVKSGRRCHRSGFPRNLAQSWSGVDAATARLTAGSAAPGINAGLELGWDQDR
jgi:hypothetical protein